MTEIVRFNCPHVDHSGKSIMWMRFTVCFASDAASESPRSIASVTYLHTARESEGSTADMVFTFLRMVGTLAASMNTSCDCKKTLG